MAAGFWLMLGLMFVSFGVSGWKRIILDYIVWVGFHIVFLSFVIVFAIDDYQTNGVTLKTIYGNPAIAYMYGAILQGLLAGKLSNFLSIFKRVKA